MWWVAVLLAVVGSFTAIIRYALPNDIHVTIVTLLLGAYGPEQLPVLASHPFTEALHRVGGIFYMALGLLQLSTGFRTKYKKLHRISGRIFLAIALLIGVSGAYISIVFPYAANEAIPSVIASALMIAFGAKSYLCIRERPSNVQGHSEWGIRCFAMGLATGMLRVMLIVLIKATPFTPRELMVPTMWASWVVTMLLAEWSIHRQRQLVWR